MKLEKKSIFQGVIIVFFICLINYPFSLFGYSSAQSETEKTVLELINRTRENPVKHFKAFGLNPARLVKNYPKLNDNFNQGFPLIDFSANLYWTAKSRADQISANAFKETGITSTQTILKKIGYFAEKSYETKSTLLFANYIKPSEAIYHLYKEILKSELNLNSGLKLLDPEINEVGARLLQGSCIRDGKKYNYYFLVITLAKSWQSKESEILFELTNQARVMPLKVAESLWVDGSSSATGIDNLILDDFVAGLSPLKPNFNLIYSAREKSDDLLNQILAGSGYSSSIESLENRLLLQGYFAEFATELQSGLASSDITRLDAANTLFYARLKKELLADSDPMDKQILNPKVQDLGIAFLSETLDSNGGIYTDSIENDSVFRQDALVMDFASSEYQEPNESMVCGHVFKDWNKNGLYDAGEGIKNIQITLKGNDEIMTRFTNRAGGYSFIVEDQGIFTCTVYLESKSLTRKMKVYNENIFAAFTAP